MIPLTRPPPPCACCWSNASSHAPFVPFAWPDRLTARPDTPPAILSAPQSRSSGPPHRRTRSPEAASVGTVNGTQPPRRQSNHPRNRHAQPPPPNRLGAVTLRTAAEQTAFLGNLTRFLTALGGVRARVLVARTARTHGAPCLVTVCFARTARTERTTSGRRAPHHSRGWKRLLRDGSSGRGSAAAAGTAAIS